MTEHPGNDDLEHLAMNELIPWYLNGTIDEAARSRFDRHLPTCPRCRADLDLDRAVHTRLAMQSTVEYMPAASLKRLNAALNQFQSGSKPCSATPPSDLHRTRPDLTRRVLRERVAVAASIVIVAVTLGVVLIDRMTESGRLAANSYHTVTTARAKPPQETIRAVFAPAMTVVQLQTVLDEARLKIVAGPTEAGVYSLAPTSTLTTAASLDILHQNAGVRFAENSQP